MKNIMRITAINLFIFLASKQGSTAQNFAFNNINDTLPPAFGTDTISSSSKTKKETGKDYVIMQAGQMLIVKDNKVERMKQAIIMSNGTIVQPGGNVLPKDGLTFILKEGERVYMNGMIALSKSRQKTE